MGVLGSGRRWLVDKLIGAEKRELRDRLERLEANLRSELGALGERMARGSEALAQGQHATDARLAEALAAAAEQQRSASGGLAAVEQRQQDLEALGRELLGRTDAAAQQAAAALQQGADTARRHRAEHRLWTQVARVDGLRLSGPARSVVFVHNSYYHFFYLARALRERGWRALCVSLEDPNGVNANYYHGEDVNLFDPDPQQLQANVEALFAFAKEHFDLMHFAGDGLLSFFPAYFGMDEPPDILEWKRLGKRVAYTISGCNSATAQSSVRAWSRQRNGETMCGNCPWELRPDVCSDERNLAWSARVHRHCDLVFSELQPSLDGLSSRHPNVVRGPVTMVLDDQLWRPDLPVPAPFLVPREPGEVLVYHAFGNYDLRGSQGRNIKGTPAIIAAVDRLRAEGFPVRLMFFSNVPNEVVRFYQAQADIVVDQLWAGSWGANGRESLMLGKPVVGFVHRHERDPADLLEAIATTPIVSATVDTVYDVLKELVQDPARRAELGARSRAFALRWHAAAAGAARYEHAYDAMLARGVTTTVPAEARPK